MSKKEKKSQKESKKDKPKSKFRKFFTKGNITKILIPTLALLGVIIMPIIFEAFRTRHQQIDDVVEAPLPVGWFDDNFNGGAPSGTTDPSVTRQISLRFPEPNSRKNLPQSETNQSFWLGCDNVENREVPNRVLLFCFLIDTQ